MFYRIWDFLRQNCADHFWILHAQERGIEKFEAWAVSSCLGRGPIGIVSFTQFSLWMGCDNVAGLQDFRSVISRLQSLVCILIAFFQGQNTVSLQKKHAKPPRCSTTPRKSSDFVGLAMKANCKSFDGKQSITGLRVDLIYFWETLWGDVEMKSQELISLRE